MQTAGHTNIDFVGSTSDGGSCNPGFPYDFDHEGHSGFSITGIADQNQLPPWLTAARPDVVVIDVSFISLKTVLPVALSLAAAPMHLLALIKPQFEAERKHSKHGIIRNAMVHQEICDDISAFAASLGCSNIQVFPSPIAGGDGNIEFFMGARRG